MAFSRQDASIDRLPLVTKGRVVAIVKRPRLMYVPDTGAPGSPVFHENGELLGMVANRRSDSLPSARIVLPVDRVAKVLAQVESVNAAAEEEKSSKQLPQSLATVGRGILESYANCVVSLDVVASRGENRREITSVGLVADGDGLIVTSATGATDRGELEEVKVITGDGSELEAEFIFKDTDLDLMFLAVDSKAVEEQGIELVKAPFLEKDVESALADPILMLTRDSPAFFRQAKIHITHVDSVVEQPRRYYRTPDKMAGAAAFDAAGNLLGMYTRRVTGEETRHRMVLPGTVILEAASRARESGENEETKADGAPEEALDEVPEEAPEEEEDGDTEANSAEGEAQPESTDAP